MYMRLVRPGGALANFYVSRTSWLCVIIIGSNNIGKLQ